MSAPKQAWTPVAEFATVGVDAVNLGPGDPQYAHRDDERVDVASLVRTDEVLRAFLTGRGGRVRVEVVHLSPGMRAVAPYPFEELDRRKAEALAAGRTLIDFGVGDPARGHARRSSGRRSRRRRSRCRPTRGRRACPSCATPCPRGSVVASACRSIPTATSCRSSDPRRSCSASRKSSWIPPGHATSVVVTAPGYPIPERGARWAGGEVAAAPLREADRLPARPGCRSRRDLGSHRTAVAQLPEQPHRRRGAARALSAGGGARAPPRVPAGLRRGVQRAVVRARGPPPSVLQAGDLANVVADQDAEQAVVDDGIPQRVRGGGSRPDRAAEAGAAERRRDAAGVRPAGVGRGMERRGARRRGARAATRAKRAVFLRMFARTGVAVGGVGGHVLPVGEGARRPSVLAWALDLLERGGFIVAPGLVLRTRGRGLRADGDGADARMSVDRPSASILEGLLALGGERVNRDDLAERIRASYADPGSPAGRTRPSKRRCGFSTSESCGSPNPTVNGGWRVNEWVKQAVLLFFRVRGLATTDVGPFEYHDRLPLKTGFASAGVRVVPARGGALRRVPVTRRRDDAQLREHRGVGRAPARWSTPGPRWARAPRSARTCICRAAWASGGSWSRCRRRRSSWRTARSSARGASSSKAL